jgi:WD40 repeat protein
VSKLVQPGDFFVVGGPVQPDRPCYVERAADAELARGIREQRFCSVLAPRSSGKSSLMARAIRALRQERQLAAVVDLAQIGLRGNAGDAGRWYYGIAYRILRELRLKVDLQAWWQEKSSLPGEQRLAEFFWEIVLANTSVPVTVFFDEAERSLDLPFGAELFATIRACYARRVSEPDYSRLNFVVLGVASAASLAPDPSVSPFIDGQQIDLADFTLAECRELAPGFRGAEEETRALVERIYGWTRGQPYMTQKVARGVARKGGRPDDVDRVVREQFLSPGGPQAEPLLNHVRSVLGDGRPATRQALALLGKIGRGSAVHYVAGAPARELLRLSGVAAVGPDGLLRYRNRIFAEAFDARWLSAARPFDWRGAGAVAALLAVAIAVPIWYGRYLPRPYVRTLSVVTQDAAVAEDAYEKLHRLPGFAATADRLMAEAMARRSRAAQNYAEVMAADTMLRKLPGSAPLADELQAGYWLRRAEDATHVGHRDEALLFSVRAARSGGSEARQIAAELIGNDYRRLLVSYRLSSPPSDWGIDWAGHRITVVDAAHRTQRLVLEAPSRSERREPAAPQSEARAPAPQAPDRAPQSAPESAPESREPAPSDGRLTALQHVPVTRELSVEDKGSAGAFRLTLRIQSAGANDLVVTLTAPSGAAVTLPVVQQSPGQELYSFSATGASPLVQLSDEARQGVWRFAIVDRAPGGVGVLVRWGLQFSDRGPEWRDSPEQGVAIPDPVRTDQVRVALSPDGRRAVAETARAGAVGELAIWDLVSGELVRDLHVQAVPERVQFNADGSRLLVQTGGRLTIWDVSSGKAVARLATQSEFVLPAALSLDGDFLVMAERVEGARPLFSLVRVADGALVASSAGIAGVKDWVLGPQARYLALLETSRVVAVFDPRRGRVLRELRHERDVRRLIAMPAGDLLITVDAGGDVRAWPLPVDGSATAADSWRLGVTVDPQSVSVSGDGSTAAFEGPDGRVVVRDIDGDLKPLYLRVDRNDPPLTTGLSPDGSALVTVNGKVLRLWRLDARELGAGPDLNLSAMALDDDGSLAVLGFRGGHVRVRSATELARAAPSETVDYIGHRGGVTSLDVNAPQNLIASGGEDGVVRVWDLATVSPAPEFMRHPIGPVHAVCLSGDGRWIASAADYSARAWRVADGKLTAELPVNGTALAVDIAPDSVRWAAGDSAGNVFFGTFDGTAPLGSVRAQGPVEAIAFAPDGRLLASGDETGTVEVWDAQRFTPVGRRQGFPYPVRWLGWSDDGHYLLIQTDQWLHRAELVSGELHVVDSRLLEVGVEAGAALEADDGRRLRLVGGRSAGRLALLDIDLASPVAAELPADSPLLARDWGAVLGLRIDENGEIR